MEVRRLIKGHYFAGHYQVSWAGNNDKAVSLGTGINYYKIKTANFNLARKMALIR